MRNDQPAASALFGCESDLSEPEIGLQHDKWQNLHGARLQKHPQTAFNSFCHFHLISSVSRPQRPLIYDCIDFSFPNPPSPPPHRRQHFREKFFRCPFHSKSAPRNRGPPTVWCFLRPCLLFDSLQVLIGITSNDKSLSGFTARELLPTECFTSLVSMLSEMNNKPRLTSKCLLLLYSLGMCCLIRLPHG